jgi:outer membrane biosynthesis protein TonB
VAAALGGPPGLARAAIDALAAWRLKPPRVNGAPMALAVVLQISFLPAP